MRISELGPFGRTPNRGLRCPLCGRDVDLGRGRHGGMKVTARVLYARLNGKTVPVAAACDWHFTGERRRVHHKKGGDSEEFVDPAGVELVRSPENRSAVGSTEEPA